MKKYDHYETYEWLGSFWTPDKSINFPGKLTYSPENGIQLSFFYPMQGKKIEKVGHIFGALSSGEICTLYGTFNPDTFGFHSGKISIYNGRLRFAAILFGENSPPTQKYDGVWLDFTNFQEFCYPQGHKDFAKYYSAPIQETKTSDLEIKLVNSVQFKFIGSGDFSNLIHCENEEVSKEIADFFRDLNERHKNEFIHVRSDIGWSFELLAADGLAVEDALKKVYSLENLISLLVYSPVRRKEISIMKKSNANPGKFEALHILTGIFDMDKWKIEVLQKPLLHMNLPITARNSNITEIFAKWLEAENGFELFSELISNRFGKTYRHQLYAEIVLTLTQLEAISYSFEKKSKEKYTFTINKYASQEVIDIMKSYFSISDNDKLGECLSDLRAEVAHVGKPAKHLKSLPIAALLGIANCIKIVVASHIYKQLDVADEQIQKFQMQQCHSLSVLKK